MCFSASKISYFEDIVSLDSAVQVLKGCKVALQFAPIPGIAAAVDLLLELVDKVKLTRTNQQMLKELSEELLNISNVVNSAVQTVERHLGNFSPRSVERRQLEEQFSEPSSLLQQRAEILCEGLECLKKQADELRRGRCLPRFLRSKRDSRMLGELKRGAESALQQFKMSSGITVEALVDDIAGRTRVIQDRVIVIQEQICDVQETIKISHEERQAERDEADLKELPRDDVSFRTAPQLDTAQYVESACGDVFEDLNAWAEGQMSTGRWRKPVWILSAPAGSGKSTVASKFAEQVHDRGSLGASVFFNAASQDRASVQRFFSTIAYQLAHSQPALRPHIAAAAREHLRNGKNQQMAFDCKNLILKPLAQLPEDHPPFVFIVDGLDECAESAPGAVTQLLEHLVSCARPPSSPVRILMTYKSQCDTVEKVLRDPKMQTTVHHLPFASDIGAFLNSRLAGLACINPSAIKSIASYAGSSFGYALAVADFLHADPGHAADRLAIVLSLGPCRKESESLYALYPALTGHAHAYRLTAAQWTKMRARVERPAVFSLCGSGMCFKHVKDWLLASHTDVASAGTIPPELLSGLCPLCHDAVGNQPLEIWILKRMIWALRTDGVDPANIFPSTSLTGTSQAQAQGQADTWLPTPRAAAAVVRSTVTPTQSQDAKHAKDTPQPSQPSPTAPPPAYETLEDNSDIFPPEDTTQVLSPTDDIPPNTDASNLDTQLVSLPEPSPREALARALTLSILSLPSPSNARTSPRTGTPRTSTPRTNSPRTPRTGTLRTPRTAWTPLARHNRVLLTHILATPMKYAAADPLADVRRVSTAVGAIVRRTPHAGWVRLKEDATRALGRDTQTGVSRSQGGTPQGVSPMGGDVPLEQKSSKRYTM
ncbi:hypothetical protein C8Q73DRAFT_794031 [Cubamyces lactineus]|nr:hypothetical protein C8Q73DRAFT_794031 [Cubamyces lactineus]